MRNFSPVLVTAALFCGLSLAAEAEVKMPAIFGDHMVLQQGMPVPVWGTADVSEEVTVTVGSISAKGTADADGKWSIKLPPMNTGSTGVTMTVAGKANTLTFNDVLVGEVWVCSGQSNMEFMMAQAHNAATELPKANDEGMRGFVVTRATSHTPLADVKGHWEVCTPERARMFSAVGYFFGKELREKLGRPVGLIGTYWGGTPAEAWTSLDGLKKEPMLDHYVAAWTKIDEGFAKATADYPAALDAYSAAMKAWTDKYGKDFEAATTAWRSAAAAAIAAKQPVPPRPALPAPTPLHPVDPSGGQYSPATLYNAMIAPLLPYGIRGVIWYQGEANDRAAQEYATLFPNMIKDWRAKWNEGDFPFLFVQLAGWRPGPGADWPTLRESQAETLSLPKTGMATAADIGLPDNIHPMDKMDVGYRLALVARHVAYGEELVYSGPVAQTVAKDGAALRVKFDDVGGGLVIGQRPWVGPNTAQFPADHLTGFEIAGADGAWKNADAKIDGETVVVSSPEVGDPVEVRYNWRAYPEGNLYNKDGLPALAFTKRP